ncbi:hypothetical protein ACFQH9_04685 [Pseudonocardia lutea]|uniref:Uncharacterized protein n=1 Tax=Pseudonocardia lutea TaxID=2172015 RepID=A0ABW1I1S8_9PSEU
MSNKGDSPSDGSNGVEAGVGKDESATTRDQTAVLVDFAAKYSTTENAVGVAGRS